MRDTDYIAKRNDMHVAIKDQIVAMSEAELSKLLEDNEHDASLVALVLMYPHVEDLSSNIAVALESDLHAQITSYVKEKEDGEYE